MEKDCFTRVLKGFIAVFTSIFPSGATVSQKFYSIINQIIKNLTQETYFDAMARRSLWNIGLDYGHGTGHGVGSFLAVHEYPPLFSSRPDATYPGLLQNMFTSNGNSIFLNQKINFIFFILLIKNQVFISTANLAFVSKMSYKLFLQIQFSISMEKAHLSTTWLRLFHFKPNFLT